MKFDKNKLVKPILAYTGNKFKLLEQILPYFPENIDTFVDLFGGGFGVGTNVKCNKIIYNDIIYQIVDMFEYFYNTDYKSIVQSIDTIMTKYNLSKTNKNEFLQFRYDYNKNKTSLYLFLLSRYSFNRMIRFNNVNDFTVPFGEREFSSESFLKFKNFLNMFKNLNISFKSLSFENLNLRKLKENDFVYCDPPYLISHADYNKFWNEDLEILLYAKLDELNNQGVKFAVSNVIQHKGLVNNILLNWIKRNNYKMIKLNYKYSSYGVKDSIVTKNKTQEVLIINYDKQPDINMNGIFEM